MSEADLWREAEKIHPPSEGWSLTMLHRWLPEPYWQAGWMVIASRNSLRYPDHIHAGDGLTASEAFTALIAGADLARVAA